MTVASGVKNRKRIFWFALCLSVCISVSAIAQDQTDPFAPNAVAPTEPSSLPKAPSSTSTFAPPQPAAPTQAQSAPVTAPVEPLEPRSDVVEAKPEPMLEKVDAKPAPAPADTSTPSGPSFWDKLETLFTSDETQKEKQAKKTPKVVLDIEPTEQSPEPQEQPAAEIPPAPVKAEEKIEPAPVVAEEKTDPAPVEKVEETTPSKPVETPTVVAVPEVKEPAPATPSKPAQPKQELAKPQFKPLVKPAQEIKEPASLASKKITPATKPERPAKAPQKMTSAEPAIPVKPATPDVQDVTKETVTEPTPFSNTSVAPTTPTVMPTYEQPPARVAKAEKEQEQEKPSLQVVEQVHEAPKLSPAVEKPVYMPKGSVRAHFEEEETGWFDTITNFLMSPFSDDEPTTAQKDNMRPQADQTNEQPNAQGTTTTLSEENPMDPRLINAKLGLGRNIFLGQGDDDLSPKAQCFTKNRGTVAYCLTPTRWPARIAKHFDVSTHLYQDTQGIVQYDGNIATSLYALFETDGFEQIVAYYQKTYGPATTHFVRKTRSITQGVVDNPTYIWRKNNATDGLIEILELRKVADTRGSIPDLKRGSIRVFFDGSRDIFRLTSDLDYMNLQ